MKYNMFIVAMVATAVSAAAGQAETAVIPTKGGAIVVLEREGKPPVYLDETVGGKVKTDVEIEAIVKESNEKGGMSAEAQAKATADKASEEKTGNQTATETTGKGKDKPECVTKTGKETDSVDKNKMDCD